MVRIIRKPRGKYLIDIHHNRSGAKPKDYGSASNTHKALSLSPPRKQVQPKPSIAEMLKKAQNASKTSD